MYTIKTKKKSNKLHFCKIPQENNNNIILQGTKHKNPLPESVQEIFTLAYIELGRGQQYLN